MQHEFCGGSLPFGLVVIAEGIKEVFAGEEEGVAIPLKAIARLIGECGQNLPLAFIGDLFVDPGEFAVDKAAAAVEGDVSPLSIS